MDESVSYIFRGVKIFGKPLRRGRAYSSLFQCFKHLLEASKGGGTSGQGKPDAVSAFIAPLWVTAFAGFSENRRKMTMMFQ